MPATVEAVIQEARDVMRDFDTDFLPTPDELVRVTNREERLVLVQVLEDAVSGFALPGDTPTSIEVSTHAESYALPGDFWRLRSDTLRLVKTDGSVRRVFLTIPEARNTIPGREPSAFIQAANLFLVDGVDTGDATNRMFGWQGVSTVDFTYVTEPAEKTDVAQELALPDEAVPVLIMRLALWLATRGKLAELTVQMIRDQLGRREAEMRRAIQSFPGGRGR